MLESAFLHIMVTKARWSIRNSEVVGSEGIRLCSSNVFTSERVSDYGWTLIVRRFLVKQVSFVMFLLPLRALPGTRSLEVLKDLSGYLNLALSQLITAACFGLNP